MIKKLFAPFNILRMILIEHRFLAYRKYAEIKKRYGVDCVICFCATLGTGDYYFSGMYLKAWLKKNNITNCVFNVLTPKHLSITKLFDYMSLYTCYIGDDTYLNKFKFFMGKTAVDYHYFLHVGSRAGDRGFLEMQPNPSYLLGYKGFSLMDCYLCLGFELPDNTRTEAAKFSDDIDELDEIISSVKAIRGKTVLISPYAASYIDFPSCFWNRIVLSLKQRGYRVLTNVGQNEEPLWGTIPLYLPYKLSVPFLDFAGNFIGVRSGLCDIISTSVCKKVVIHPYHAFNWQNGTSFGFTSLNGMGICDDAVELVMSDFNENEFEVSEEVVRVFNFIPYSTNILING